MALVDELDIYAQAGKGGDGVVRWLHLKGKEYSGPAGGNGGDGGDFYIEGVRDIGLLARYRGEKTYKAEDGVAGASASMHGKRGEDFTFKLPVGSLITNEATGEQYELLQEGEKKLILKGGRGGAGNEAFKSSVNRQPEEYLEGGKGEEATLHIELRLIADAGLVGLPNAGKTSLLNALTGAQAKVGSYAFTTLDPNLGVLYGYVLADIPGLIEGASEGKGLGFKFLRHIARTKLLLHCVSLEEENPMQIYKTVRDELSRFDDGALAHKPELIILTKTDMRTPQEVAALTKQFEALGNPVATVTVLDDAAVKALQEVIVKALR